MPRIAVKIAHTSLVEIKLYKEGIFWVAYEQSAYYIAQLKGYKPTKKYFKNIQKEVIQVGFPKIENLLKTKGIKVLTQQNAFVCFNIETAIEPLKFEDWKNNVTIIKPKAKIIFKNKELQNSILNFDVSNKTPIQAMCFINELKFKINNGNI